VVRTGTLFGLLFQPEDEDRMCVPSKRRSPSDEQHVVQCHMMEFFVKLHILEKYVHRQGRRRSSLIVLLAKEIISHFDTLCEVRKPATPCELCDCEEIKRHFTRYIVGDSLLWSVGS
jgi:hypothetical protein